MASKDNKILFTTEKDTKNTMKYSEVVADGAPTFIGSLYVQKHAVASLALGDKVALTVAPANDKAVKDGIQFKLEKDTKNTMKYTEIVADGAPTIIGSLYVQKHAVASLGLGDEIAVKLEVSK